MNMAVAARIQLALLPSFRACGRRYGSWIRGPSALVVIVQRKSVCGFERLRVYGCSGSIFSKIQVNRKLPRMTLAAPAAGISRVADLLSQFLKSARERRGRRSDEFALAGMLD